MTDERRPHRKAGCASLGKCLMAAGAVLLAAFVYQILNLGCRYPPDLFHRLQARSVIAEIKSGLESYEVDYNRYPVQADDLAIKDVSVRSRGMLLKVLMGEYVPTFNQRGREVIYADLKMARNRQDGLWQDGEERVLSDHWGEPYYIILDTNRDLKIDNPEFGASTSDPKQAEFDRKYPPPKQLALTVAVYSSGPDRDPKTWEDNVCSWRPH